MRRPLPPGFLTVPQLAKELHISPTTVHQLMLAGDVVPDHRYFKRWLFRPDQVDEVKAMLVRKQSERHKDGTVRYSYIYGDLAPYIRMRDAVEQLRRADPDGKGVSSRTLYRWIYAGKLQAFFHGRGLAYLLRSEVDELCARLADRTLIANRPK